MDDFMSSPLVSWVASLCPIDIKEKALLELLVDGVFLAELLLKIDSAAFSLLKIQHGINGDATIRAQNLFEILQGVKRFYQDKLQHLLVMKLPNVVEIAKDPDSVDSLHDLQKILLLILGCAVQCDGKEKFIEGITELDVAVQEGLVVYIQEITENPEYVMSYRLNEIGECPAEERSTITENMYYQLQRLMQERDEYNEILIDMNLERLSTDSLPSKDHLQIVGSPPLSPGTSFKASFYQKNKTKLRDLQMDLEEKNLLLMEARDELSGLRSTVDALKTENKSLLTDARWAATYRDELDIMKSQVDKASKLETENIKYKEKMRELDFYKKRYEELKEQHELLYETKLVLEEQVKSSSSLAEKAGGLDQENSKLRKQIDVLTTENESNERRVDALMDDVQKLSCDRESSFSEMSSLNAELDGLRHQHTNVPVVPLALECNESSSTEVLRLEKENRHLKKLVDSLKQQFPAIRELERQNKLLDEKLKDHRNTIRKMTEELTFEKKRADDMSEVLTGQASRINNNQQSSDVEHRIPKKLLDELEQKGIDLEALQNLINSDASHNEKLNNVEVSSMKQIRSIKDDLDKKNTELVECESRLIDVEASGKKLDAELGKKSNEIARLESRVKEFESYGEKVEDQLAQREKDIVVMERRFENSVTENKTLHQTIFLKDDKINALEERISYFMDSASQDTRKSNETLEKKLKETQGLELKVMQLQEDVQSHEKTKSELQQKSARLDELVKDVQEKEQRKLELEIELEKALSQASQSEHSSKLKAERVRSLESSLEELRVESSMQYETKVSSLTEALKHKSEALDDMESRLDEVKSLNNKLKSVTKTKNDRIQTLEDLITDFEGKSNHTRDEKVENLSKKLQSKDNHLASLENRLEDSMGRIVKQGKSIEMKDTKIDELELQVQELQEIERHTKLLNFQLQEKSNRLTEMETTTDELKSNSQKLEALVSQKERKLSQAQTSLLELENALSDHGSLSKLVQLKDDKINLLQGSLVEKEKIIVELETRCDDTNIKVDKLNYTVKIKDEKLLALEERLDNFDSIESQRSKTQSLLDQRDRKLKELENNLDEAKEVDRFNQRLKESVKQKEDKIISLEERLHDLNEAVNINTRLNNQVEVKDKTISAQQKRVCDLEEALKKVEHTRDSIKQNAEEEILQLHGKIDDLTDVRVKRQHSLRRRDLHISTLENKLEEIETTTQDKEVKIQHLQSRLQGTASKFKTLGMSNEEKDERIKELETRLNELSATYKENMSLTSKLDLATKQTEYKDKTLRKLEDTTSRDHVTIEELTSKLENLQQRLDDILSLNNRLDATSKKLEEKNRALEIQLQGKTDECGRVNNERNNYEKLIEKHTKRIRELEETIASLEKEIRSLSDSHYAKEKARRQELLHSNKKLNEKDDLIDDLERKVESAPTRSRQEVVVIPISNHKDEKQAELQALLKSVTNENHQLKIDIQEKQTTLSEFEKKVDELHSASASNNKRMNVILKEKTTQINLLKTELDSSKEELAKLDTKCLEFTTGESRNNHTLKQKDLRIQTIKEELEKERNRNHDLINENSLHKEKITSLEQSLLEAIDRQKVLTEEYSALQAEVDTMKGQSDKTKSNVERVVEKIQLTKRARTELHITRAPPRLQHIVKVSDLSENRLAREKHLTALEKQLSLLEKEKSRIAIQNHALATENASIRTENESLRSELELLRSDYAALKSDLFYAKEQYKELDITATKIVHRCEVLAQLNATLEEENSALMEQVKKSLAQNQDLLTYSMQTKDEYFEEERAFSDQLFLLERQKEQLIEEVNAANRTPIDQQKQKKSGFWRGANKVLQKAGLKKRKDDPTGCALHAQSSIDADSPPEGGSSSSFSPRQHSDDGRIPSPVEFPVENHVIMRQPMERHDRPVTYYTDPSAANYRSPLDSPSNSSDRSSNSSRQGRSRPISEYQLVSTPMSTRSRNNDLVENFKADNTAFLSGMRARNADSENSVDYPDYISEQNLVGGGRDRTVSNTSTHSTQSNTSLRSQSTGSLGNRPGRGIANGPFDHSRDHSPSVQRVRVTEKVIPSSPQAHHVKDELKMIAEYMTDVPVKEKKRAKDVGFRKTNSFSTSDEYDRVDVDIYDGGCEVVFRQPSIDETTRDDFYTPSIDGIRTNQQDRIGPFSAPSSRHDPRPSMVNHYGDGLERQTSPSYIDGNHSDVDVIPVRDSPGPRNPSRNPIRRDETNDFVMDSSDTDYQPSTNDGSLNNDQSQRTESDGKKNPIWYEYGCV